MDINSLPLEILREILSYLSNDQLKMVSLVCHRWNQISGKLLVRSVQLRISANNLSRICRSSRSYRSIRFHQLDEWELLQSAVSECFQRFPDAREISITYITPSNLLRMYRTYPDWMEQLESLRIFIHNEDTCGPEYYTIALPNLKQLHWTDNSAYSSPNIVTINAPRLERINVYGGFKDSYIRIVHCDRLKHVWFRWNDKQFLDLFTSNIGNVETLILYIDKANFDISFLVNIHQLQYLSLIFELGTNALQKVNAILNAIRCSKLLKCLSIRSCYGIVEGILNLERIFSDFENLEWLGLCGITLTANKCIHAGQLKYIHLREVAHSGSIISLNAPKLRSLALPGDFLEKLQFNESKHLSDLRLEVTFSPFEKTFERIIFSFIEQHKNLKNLALTGACFEPNIVSVSHDLISGSVEHLELSRLHVSMDFFRLLAKWKSLKSLKLVSSFINCSQTPNDVVQLPGVERMIIGFVRLVDRPTSDFPIISSDTANQNVSCEWDAYSTPGFTTGQQKKKFDHFCHPS